MIKGVYTSKLSRDYLFNQRISIKDKAVLLADPNPSHRANSLKLISDFFHVYEAADGLEALRKAKCLQPAVIISTIQMPKMSGLELCNSIRSQHEVNCIPIILMADKVDTKNQLACYKAGADVLLNKPLKKDLIIQIIANYLLKQEKIKQQLLAKTRHHHFSSIEPYNEKAEFLKKVVKSIEERIADTEINAQYLCTKLGTSRTNLYGKIKKFTGKSVHEFIKFVRLNNSLEHLLEGRLSISQVAFEVGFNSHSYFDKCFIKHYGLTPKEYIRQHSVL